ncbi:MAG: MarR family transcriptional regulator [Colwellia sp.]|nr:MarR family transcriptional regulator [Colwellia sp.]
MNNNLLLEKQLCFRLYSLNKLMCRLYVPVLKELALTYPQYLVMMVLWQYKAGISVKDLGAQLDLDSGTLSPLLKRMEKQMLIKRERDSTDERVVLIKLTQKGVELQKSAEHIPAKMFVVTGLSPDKLQELNLTLDQLIDNLGD